MIAIISIIGGVIAASSYIVSKKADAKEYLDKLVPYQGFVGIALLIYSIMNALKVFANFSLPGIAIVVAQFVVGFLLGYSLLSQYLFSKNEEAKEKGQEIRAKLVQYQVPAGLTLIVLGVLRLLNIF